MIAEVPSWSPDIDESDNIWEQGMVPYILKNDLDDEVIEVIKKTFDAITKSVPCIAFK